MDIATIAGIIGGFVLMLVALFIAGSHGGGVSLTQFVDPPAAIMVLGGGLCVVMTSVPMGVFLGLPKAIMGVIMPKRENLPGLVAEIVELAEVARREGLLALERKIADIKSATLVSTIQMAVDGTRPEVITEIMHKTIEVAEHHMHVEKKMFEIMGKCGPAFGMIATLLGLILMLGNLSDPDSIGPTMAMALVGTLYGAAMANMICMPLAEKVAYYGKEAISAQHIILDGILAIQAGDNPRVVEQKLSTYLGHAAHKDHKDKKAA
ncbi:MAG: MotA/TolQ/ExbB proton channel family protein [Pirellulales bacterium]|nr:MotA/TolQ/ExbB proton channel family protein [Pirellulales bacterium]